MVKGKRWKIDDEKKLIKMAKEGADLETLARTFKKSQMAIRMKLRNLGVEVKKQISRKNTFFTTELKLPDDLLSPQEALRIVAGALKKAAEPGLEKLDIQRLQVVATLHKTYNEGLEDYVRYRDIEKEILELKKQLDIKEET